MVSALIKRQIKRTGAPSSYDIAEHVKQLHHKSIEKICDFLFSEHIFYLINSVKSLEIG